VLRWVVVVTALAGCRWYFEELPATGDGSTGDGLRIDARLVDATFRGNKLTYIKPSNTGAGDQFGTSVAVSGDGNTFAVSAAYEDSAATGIDGPQGDDLTTQDSGAVYVFVRSGATWVQQAYVKASNTGAGDLFGSSVALSADGNTLAVGAYLEDSASAGINGDDTSNALMDSGAVYVFTRSGATWSQQAYIKSPSPDAVDQYGRTLSMSADGNTLAVGAYLESSNATGVNGDSTNNLAPKSGAAYVYTRTGSTWSLQAYIKASNTNMDDQFGWCVSLAADGNTLAVSAVLEDASATGGQADNSATDAGAGYVFKRAGTTWSQIAYLKAANADAVDYFGQTIAITGTGAYVAIGALLEDSNATGIDGNAADNTATQAGAAYVFARSGDAFTPQAYVKAINTDSNDGFGRSLVFSADGFILAVGALLESSNATGIDGNAADNSATSSGASYVYARSGATWAPRAYVKATNTNALDRYGAGIAMSSDATVMLVGSLGESSAATGVDGDQLDNTAMTAGAAYLIESL
jgi:hypothetical protein